jgi:hypothetical protein
MKQTQKEQYAQIILIAIACIVVDMLHTITQIQIMMITKNVVIVVIVMVVVIVVIVVYNNYLLFF